LTGQTTWGMSCGQVCRAACIPEKRRRDRRTQPVRRPAIFSALGRAQNNILNPENACWSFRSCRVFLERMERTVLTTDHPFYPDTPTKTGVHCVCTASFRVYCFVGRMYMWYQHRIGWTVARWTNRQQVHVVGTGKTGVVAWLGETVI